MGAEHIINDISLGNKICTTNEKVLYMVLLHQLPGLDFSQTAEHFTKLIQRYKIGVPGKIAFIKFSAFHILINLSRYLVIEGGPWYNKNVIYLKVNVLFATPLLTHREMWLTRCKVCGFGLSSCIHLRICRRFNMEVLLRERQAIQEKT